MNFFGLKLCGVCSGFEYVSLCIFPNLGIFLPLFLKDFLASTLFLLSFWESSNIHVAHFVIITHVPKSLFMYIHIFNAFLFCVHLGNSYFIFRSLILFCIFSILWLISLIKIWFLVLTSIVSFLFVFVFFYFFAETYFFKYVSSIFTIGLWIIFMMAALRSFPEYHNISETPLLFVCCLFPFKLRSSWVSVYLVGSWTLDYILELCAVIKSDVLEGVFDNILSSSGQHLVITGVKIQTPIMMPLTLCAAGAHYCLAR